jgi:MtN3 and saliva related transmembrane protein
MSVKLISVLGFVAAALTSLSYIPQVGKALPRDSTGDLSLKMLVALFAGLALWIVYGLIVADIVIVIANCVGAALVAVVLACKVRDIMAQRRKKFGLKEG